MKNILFQINDMAAAIFNRREREQRISNILTSAFTAIDSNDTQAFDEILNTQMNNTTQNVILCTIVERKNMDFLRKSLTIFDAGHKSCCALTVAAQTHNLEAVRVLIPLSHPTQLYYAADKTITELSADKSEEHKSISLQCFDELLRWIDPKHDQSSLLRTALLFNVTEIIERLWGVSDLQAVANAKKVMYDLGRQNSQEQIDAFWGYAAPKKQTAAIEGAVSKGHFDLVKHLVAQTDNFDATGAVVEAVINFQEECFEFLLPLSNPLLTLNSIKKALDYHKKHSNICFPPDYYPLLAKLEQHCETELQRQVLTQAVEQTQNNTIPSAPKRRM